MKAYVRCHNPKTIHDLEQCVIHVFTNEITLEMCNRVFASFVRRLEKCVETEGKHVEKNEVFLKLKLIL